LTTITNIYQYNDDTNIYLETNPEVTPPGEENITSATFEWFIKIEPEPEPEPIPLITQDENGINTINLQEAGVDERFAYKLGDNSGMKYDHGNPVNVTCPDNNYKIMIKSIDRTSGNSTVLYDTQTNTINDIENFILNISGENTGSGPGDLFYADTFGNTAAWSYWRIDFYVYMVPVSVAPSGPSTFIATNKTNNYQRTYSIVQILNQTTPFGNTINTFMREENHKYISNVYAENLFVGSSSIDGVSINDIITTLINNGNLNNNLPYHFIFPFGIDTQEWSMQHYSASAIDSSIITNINTHRNNSITTWDDLTVRENEQLFVILRNQNYGSNDPYQYKPKQFPLTMNNELLNPIQNPNYNITVIDDVVTLTLDNSGSRVRYSHTYNTQRLNDILIGVSNPVIDFTCSDTKEIIIESVDISFNSWGVRTWNTRVNEINNMESYLENIRVINYGISYTYQLGPGGLGINKPINPSNPQDIYVYSADITPPITEKLSNGDNINLHGIKAVLQLWINNPTDTRFTDIYSLPYYGPITGWNLTEVTDFSELFKDTINFNEDIGVWDTSNVTNMSEAFYNAQGFNYVGIDNWNTSNVTDMSKMFAYTDSFNQSLNQWDTSSVTNMSEMFRGAQAFNSDISNWNTSNVTNMSGMFRDAVSFVGWRETTEDEEILQVSNIPAKVSLTIEMKGGSGGSGSRNTNSGGEGTLVQGTISVPSNGILYLNIGGHGQTAENTELGTVGRYGGYNGGGLGGLNDPKNRGAGGGGGASSIAFVTGTLETIGSSQIEQIIAVAGGGGGGASGSGGAHGGSNSDGYRGTNNTNPNHGLAGKVGTTTSGGIGSQFVANGLGNGSFGKGGNAIVIKDDDEPHVGGGGGGGLYGGGSGTRSDDGYRSAGGGGSGSSWINPTHGTTTSITGNNTDTPTEHGYIKITLNGESTTYNYTGSVTEVAIVDGSIGDFEVLYKSPWPEHPNPEEKWYHSGLSYRTLFYRVENVTDMSRMFQGASNFGKLHLIAPDSSSRIRTTGVYSGNNALFWGHRNTENGSITAPRVTLGYTGMEYWKVKNVVNMNYMFKDCTSLDTHTFMDGRPWSGGYLDSSTRYEDFMLTNLETAKEMFSGCTSLNQDLTYVKWTKYLFIENLKNNGIMIEIEGGSGGGGVYRGNNGGRGTFIRAKIDYNTLTTTTLYVHLGRNGGHGSVNGGGNGGDDGGTGGYHTIKRRGGGGGGGASFISLVPGTLSDIETNNEMDNILLIAGGGGGGGSGTLVDDGLTATSVDGYGGSNSDGFKGGGNNGEYGDPGIMGSQNTTAGQDAQYIDTFVQVMNQSRFEPQVGGGGGEGYKGGSAGERSQDGYAGGGGGGSGSSWTNPAYITTPEITGNPRSGQYRSGYVRVSYDNGSTWTQYDSTDFVLDVPMLNQTFSEATENMFYNTPSLDSDWGITKPTPNLEDFGELRNESTIDLDASSSFDTSANYVFDKYTHRSTMNTVNFKFTAQKGYVYRFSALNTQLEDLQSSAVTPDHYNTNNHLNDIGPYLTDIADNSSYFANKYYDTSLYVYEKKSDACEKYNGQNKDSLLPWLTRGFDKGDNESSYSNDARYTNPTQEEYLYNASNVNKFLARSTVDPSILNELITNNIDGNYNATDNGINRHSNHRGFYHRNRRFDGERYELNRKLCPQVGRNNRLSENFRSDRIHKQLLYGFEDLSGAYASEYLDTWHRSEYKHNNRDLNWNDQMQYNTIEKNPNFRNGYKNLKGTWWLTSSGWSGLEATEDYNNNNINQDPNQNSAPLFDIAIDGTSHEGKTFVIACGLRQGNVTALGEHPNSGNGYTINEKYTNALRPRHILNEFGANINHPFINQYSLTNVLEKYGTPGVINSNDVFNYSKVALKTENFIVLHITDDSKTLNEILVDASASLIDTSIIDNLDSPYFYGSFDSVNLIDNFSTFMLNNDNYLDNSGNQLTSTEQRKMYLYGLNGGLIDFNYAYAAGNNPNYKLGPLSLDGRNQPMSTYFENKNGFLVVEPYRPTRWKWYDDSIQPLSNDPAGVYPGYSGFIAAGKEGKYHIMTSKTLITDGNFLIEDNPPNPSIMPNVQSDGTYDYLTNAQWVQYPPISNQLYTLNATGDSQERFYGEYDNVSLHHEYGFDYLSMNREAMLTNTLRYFNTYQYDPDQAHPDVGNYSYVGTPKNIYIDQQNIAYTNNMNFALMDRSQYHPVYNNGLQYIFNITTRGSRDESVDTYGKDYQNPANLTGVQSPHISGEHGYGTGIYKIRINKPSDSDAYLSSIPARRSSEQSLVLHNRITSLLTGGDTNSNYVTNNSIRDVLFLTSLYDNHSKYGHHFLLSNLFSKAEQGYFARTLLNQDDIVHSDLVRYINEDESNFMSRIYPNNQERYTQYTTYYGNQTYVQPNYSTEVRQFITDAKLVYDSDPFIQYQWNQSYVSRYGKPIFTNVFSSWNPLLAEYGQYNYFYRNGPFREMMERRELSTTYIGGYVSKIHKKLITNNNGNRTIGGIISDNALYYKPIENEHSFNYKNDEISLTFEFPDKVKIKEFVTLHNDSCQKCHIEISNNEGSSWTTVYDGNIDLHTGYKWSKVNVHSNNHITNHVRVRLYDNVKPIISNGEMYFNVEKSTITPVNVNTTINEYIVTFDFISVPTIENITSGISLGDISFYDSNNNKLSVTRSILSENSNLFISNENGYDSYIENAFDDNNNTRWFSSNFGSVKIYLSGIPKTYTFTPNLTFKENSNIKAWLPDSWTVTYNNNTTIENHIGEQNYTVLTQQDLTIYPISGKYNIN
jgi:surface protein